MNVSKMDTNFGINYDIKTFIPFKKYYLIRLGTELPDEELITYRVIQNANLVSQPH